MGRAESPKAIKIPRAKAERQKSATEKKASAGTGGGEKMKKAQVLAVKALKENEGGLRHGELVAAVMKLDPSLKENTVSRALVDLLKDVPEVIKGDDFRAPYQLKSVVERGEKEEEVEEAEIEKKEKTEWAYLKPFRNWLIKQQRCQVAAVTGNTRKGKPKKWMIPDVVGRRNRNLIPGIPDRPEITSVELKYDSSWRFLIQGYGQASVYRVFSHRTFFVIPKQVKLEHRDLIDRLCEISGIGLVYYDNHRSPESVEFEEILRPRLHDPDHDQLDWITGFVDWESLGRDLKSYTKD